MSNQQPRSDVDSAAAWVPDPDRHLPAQPESRSEQAGSRRRGRTGCVGALPGRLERPRAPPREGRPGGARAAPRPPWTVRPRSPAPTSPSSRSTRSCRTPVSRARSSTRRRWPSWCTRSRRSGCSSRSSYAAPGSRRYELIMGERRWRATRRPASTPSRRSCARPATTRCCATRCWRTCTARSSTRSRRRRRTASCSTTSAAPTTSSPAGSVAAARRSATPCGC